MWPTAGVARRTQASARRWRQRDTCPAQQAARGGPQPRRASRHADAGGDCRRGAARSAEVRSMRGQRACRGLLYEAGTCGWRGGKTRLERALACCCAGASCPAARRQASLSLRRAAAARPGHAQPLMSAWEHSTRDTPGAGGLAFSLSLARRRCTGSNLQRCSTTQPSTGARAVTSRDLSRRPVSVQIGMPSMLLRLQSACVSRSLVAGTGLSMLRLEWKCN